MKVYAPESFFLRQDRDQPVVFRRKKEAAAFPDETPLLFLRNSIMRIRDPVLLRDSEDLPVGEVIFRLMVSIQAQDRMVFQQIPEQVQINICPEIYDLHVFNLQRIRRIINIFPSFSVQKGEPVTMGLSH